MITDVNQQVTDITSSSKSIEDKVLALRELRLQDGLDIKQYKLALALYLKNPQYAEEVKIFKKLVLAKIWEKGIAETADSTYNIGTIRDC